MGNKIEVLIAQGLDVLIFFKDVPNFVKDVSKVSMFILRRGNDLQSLPEGPQMII